MSVKDAPFATVASLQSRERRPARRTQSEETIVRQRRIPRLVIFTLLTLPVALTGCRLDAALEVRLDADGGGRIAARLVADEELVEAASASGTDPLAEAAREALAAGWSADLERLRDGARALVVAADFSDPEEFEQLVAEFAQALAGPELRPLGPFTLMRDADGLRLEGTAGLVPTPAVGDLGLDPERAVALLGEAVDYEVRVRLPGEVLDTNADRVDGRDLTWQVPAGETVSVEAAGEAPESRTWLLILGGLVAAALSALLLWRRSAPTPAPVEQGPVEQGPVEQGPVEQGPVEQGPVEQGPVEQGPVD
jgi:hypothetical protein